MFFCNHAGTPQNEYQPVVEDQRYPDAALPRGSANHNATTSLHDEGEKERQPSSARWQPADASRIKEGFTGSALMPVNVSRQHRLLGQVVVNIPHHLENALAATVIGNYAEIFRNADIYLSSLESVKSPGDIGSSQLMSELQHKMSNSLLLDFGHGSYQWLPLYPLTRLATVDRADYECIIQLLMEAILLAPNARQNLCALIRTQLPIPESLKLFYMSRLPSEDSSEDLWKKLACECEKLILSLKASGCSSTPNKVHRYLAQAYDAFAYLIKRKTMDDFTKKWNNKVAYHRRASQERSHYHPCSDLDAALLLLEQARSAQSEGYSLAEIAVNSAECALTQKLHSEDAHEVHKRAITDHAMPLLKALNMTREMSEPAALVANLRFDVMLRDLRRSQIDLLLHPEEHKHRRCMVVSEMVESEVRRIQDLLCWRTVHARLWFKMEKSVLTLRKEVEAGDINSVALDDPSVSE